MNKETLLHDQADCSQTDILTTFNTLQMVSDCWHQRYIAITCFQASSYQYACYLQSQLSMDISLNAARLANMRTETQSLSAVWLVTGQNTASTLE